MSVQMLLFFLKRENKNENQNVLVKKCNQDVLWTNKKLFNLDDIEAHHYLD